MSHPQFPYVDFESKWLLESARVAGGQTTVLVSAMSASEIIDAVKNGHVASNDLESNGKKRTHLSIPIVRCDIVNMTRHVHHHYDYSKDGHSRT